MNKKMGSEKEIMNSKTNSKTIENAQIDFKNIRTWPDASQKFFIWQKYQDKVSDPNNNDWNEFLIILKDRESPVLRYIELEQLLLDDD